MRKQKRAHCQVVLSQDALCRVCRLEESNKGNQSPHPNSSHMAPAFPYPLSQGTADRWPPSCTRHHKALPAQLLKHSTKLFPWHVSPKASYALALLSMDTPWKLCHVGFSQNHVALTRDNYIMLPNRWARSQRRISSSTRCRNPHSYWLWSQATTDLLEKLSVSKDTNNNCSL